MRRIGERCSICGWTIVGDWPETEVVAGQARGVGERVGACQPECRDHNTPALPPAWPRDAVMIVASRRGTEVREQMDDPALATCRECKREVCYDTATLTRARAHAGRPIDFFCIECATLYDRSTIEVLQR